MSKIEYYSSIAFIAVFDILDFLNYSDYIYADDGLCTYIVSPNREMEFKCGQKNINLSWMDFFVLFNCDWFGPFPLSFMMRFTMYRSSK